MAVGQKPPVEQSFIEVPWSNATPAVATAPASLKLYLQTQSQPFTYFQATVADEDEWLRSSTGSPVPYVVSQPGRALTVTGSLVLGVNSQFYVEAIPGASTIGKANQTFKLTYFPPVGFIDEDATDDIVIRFSDSGEPCDSWNMFQVLKDTIEDKLVRVSVTNANPPPGVKP
ncbi:MAG: hypothetical protein CBB60_001055 [Armatimonadetes bacterium Cent15-Ar3]|nr:MAG: hypothetical protein CBB60_001055 [Armatimonadetes bacterium Cent15-Ar3]